MHDIGSPEERPPEGAATVAEYGGKILLIHIRIVDYSGPHLALLPSTHIPLAAYGSKQIIPTISI